MSDRGALLIHFTCMAVYGTYPAPKTHAWKSWLTCRTMVDDYFDFDDDDYYLIVHQASIKFEDGDGDW